LEIAIRVGFARLPAYQQPKYPPQYQPLGRLFLLNYLMGKIYARLTTGTSADETRTFALHHSHSQNLCCSCKETVKPADF
jgi:hypothetical protein